MSSICQYEVVKNHLKLLKKKKRFIISNTTYLWFFFPSYSMYCWINMTVSTHVYDYNYNHLCSIDLVRIIWHQRLFFLFHDNRTHFPNVILHSLLFVWFFFLYQLCASIQVFCCWREKKKKCERVEEERERKTEYTTGRQAKETICMYACQNE